MLTVYAIGLFVAVGLALLAGFPVAFTLAGMSLIIAGIGMLTGHFDPTLLQAFPNRLYGVMTNYTLVAVPLFVFMGVILERSKLADQLLSALAGLMGGLRGGLGVAVVLVGGLMAASTGIVGATVVTMGLLSLPTMLRQGYDGPVAAGTICASGTLGQIIPPSIVLVLLGDVLSNAYQQAQLQMGIFSPDTVSVGELFVGAIIPGAVLVLAYLVYLVVRAHLQPASMPVVRDEQSERPGIGRLLLLLAGPLLLIIAVLGSIMAGIATPTEAAAVGAVGAMALAAVQGRFSVAVLRDCLRQTVLITSMVFMILIAAALFSLVFRGFGGDEVVQNLLTDLPGGTVTAVIIVMVVMFLLGFILDFIEITFVVVPIVGPILLAMGLDPVWLGIMIAINLQTSFLTPPFGFSLFYLRGVAPEALTTPMIYKGVMPFIAIQLLMLGALALWPQLATWLPQVIYG